MSSHGHSVTPAAANGDAHTSSNGRHSRVETGCCGTTPVPASSAEQRAPRALNLRRLWQRADKAWLAIALIPLLLAILDPTQVVPAVRFAVGAILRTGMFIAGAVLAVAWLRATGAEALLSRAFTGTGVAHDSARCAGRRVGAVLLLRGDPVHIPPCWRSERRCRR